MRSLTPWYEPFGRNLAATARLLGVDSGASRQPAGGGGGGRPVTPHPARPLLLPRTQRYALGLIATSIVTPTVDRMQRLFPEYEWDGYVERLAADGLVEVEPKAVVVEGVAYDAIRAIPAVLATIENDDEENRELLEGWAAAYEVRREHSDIGYLLGMTYLQLGRFEDSVEAMVDVAGALEPGSDHGVYVTIFDQIATLNGERKLSPNLRIRFRDAYGTCLSRIGRYEEALGQFKKLR